MEWLVQIGALLLALTLAIVQRFNYAPSSLSQAELGRRATSGDAAAADELRRRPLQQALVGLRVAKSIIVSALLASLLIATHVWWIGLLFLVVYLVLAEIIAVKGWVDGIAATVQRLAEPRIVAAAGVLAPVAVHVAPVVSKAGDPQLASKQDLADLIARDTHILTAREKSKLQSALTFGSFTVTDAMVPRDNIVSVDANETVGPVLLDRLHKAGHNIVVVVKKNIDVIQGLLYMHDIVQPDPDLKKVKDALRPSVHYIAANAPLSAVLVASLQSGRQLFIVVDDNGNTQGLITLRDALVKLMGTAPPNHIYTSTDPKKAAL